MRTNLVRTSVNLIVSDESEMEEHLDNLRSTSNLSSVLEVNFTVMMEMVFLCEELSKLDSSVQNRMDSEVMEETGFWGSLVRGFKAR